jgi:hypothetical protein
MNKTCIQCGQPFEAKRADARFFSNVCRAHHHNTHKGRNTQPQTQLPMFQAPIAQPIPPQNYGLYGVEDPRIQRLQDKIETLQEKNRSLEIELLNAKANAQIQEQISKFKEDMEPEPAGGLQGLVDTITGNDRLMNLAEKFIEAKVINAEGGGGEGNLLAGLDEEKRTKLHALIEISKSLDDSVIESLLKIAGAAYNDPAGFMQGLQEANAQPEAHQVENPKIFIP